MTDRTEPGGFDDFVESSLPALVRFATSLTSSQDDAWDLVQGGLERLLVSWRQVDHERNPAAYARVILVRLNLNRLRSIRREFAANRRSVAAPAGRAGADPLAYQFEPWLETGLAQLSAKQRTAVALVHVWNYTIDETAEIMGCAPNTVKTHLSRGMSALRSAVPNSRREEG